jgi:cell division GTPase FtsZ
MFLKHADKCEVNSAIDSIHKMANDKSNIIYGVMKDNSLENTVNVAVIASGYDT